MQRRIFLVSFLIMFVCTLLLCISTEKPLIFNPPDYSLQEIAVFALFISFWCFLLVYISLPFINSFRPAKLRSHHYEAFYLLSTFIFLQIVTIVLGYLESAFVWSATADLLYYYRGVSNSRIYIITGNITAVIAASLYARHQYHKTKTEENSKLDLK